MRVRFVFIYRTSYVGSTSRQNLATVTRYADCVKQHFRPSRRRLVANYTSFITRLLWMNSNKLLTNCSSIHPKLNSYSLVQNNNGSNFLNLQLYLSAMISSQSALLLVILASSLILTCHSQIKLTPCLNLVIFISETSVVFVISFLFLQLQRLPIHSSPANLIIVIHSTMPAFRKLT